MQNADKRVVRYEWENLFAKDIGKNKSLNLLKSKFNLTKYLVVKLLLSCC